MGVTLPARSDDGAAPPVVWAGWEVSSARLTLLIVLSEVTSAVCGEGVADGVERSHPWLRALTR